MAGTVEAGAQIEPRRDYGTIVVVGGGCYGSQYVRQLRRARAAGRASWRRLVVVDRDPQCAHTAAIGADPDGAVDLSGRPDAWSAIGFVRADWAEFFDGWLAEAARMPEGREADTIVPSPLMPHLLFDWLLQRARQRSPHAQVAAEVPGEIAGVPWQKAGMGGSRYASYATWICPVNCIEPEKCPHTGGARAWSFHESLLAGSAPTAVLRVTHRQYGVGMIDVAEVVAADAFIAASLPGAGQVRVATASHCHAAIGGISFRLP